METAHQTEVIIIGAGPTGLMLANQLNRFQIDFIILDSKSGPTVESRAIAITSRSLEIYQQLGLVDKVIAEGAKMTSFNIYSKGKRKAAITIGEIGVGISEFSYLLAYEQYKNEKLLYAHLLQNGKDVMWETSFEKMNDLGNGISMTAINQGKQININGKYLVGCDGARSPVRHQLNFSFKGGTYENKFFVADTLVKWDLGYDKLIISPGDHNFCGFFPLKDQNAYRILGTLPDDQRFNEHITFQEIESTIKSTISVKMEFEKVNWFSIYKLHHRCVDVFAKGRVFLAGDSAHIHSPAGGQGMNTGLQDACNLAWKLAFVIQEFAKPSLLQSYNEERLPFARWLLKFTDRLFKIITSDNFLIVIFRKYAALPLSGIAIRSTWLKNMAFRTLSQTGYSYKGKSLSFHDSKQKLKFKAGDRLPFVTENGSSIYLKLTGPSFYLLHIADQEKESSIPATFLHFPFQYIFIKRSESWIKLGVSSDLFILVRPDNYILAVMDHFSKQQIDQIHQRM